MSSQPLKLFLLAGEPSGDRLGAALIRGLRAEAGRELVLDGVGGPAMAAEGVQSRFPFADIAVMGLAEVLPRLPTLLRRMRETREALIAARPDALITIDAPAFGLRVAAKARASLPGACFIHYVAPSVWAWRPKRADRMAAHTDHLLALLPFEPPYFHRVGLSCDFVGHPIARAREVVDPADQSLRAELGIAPEARVITALPGSRRGEVAKLGPVIAETLGLLQQRSDRPIVALAPAAETVVAQVREAAAEWPTPTHVLAPDGRPFADAERRKWRAMAASDAAIAASGTVSLELAAMRTPMVIAYRTAWVTAAIVRRIAMVDTVTLVNLVSETRAVPEFLQEYIDPPAMAAALDALSTPGDDARQAQLAACDATIAALGAEGAPPGARAARSVLAAIERGRSA